MRYEERLLARDNSTSLLYLHSSPPLVELARDGWKDKDLESDKPKHPPPIPRGRNNSSWMNLCLAIFSAPRFRRYIWVYVLLLFFCWVAWVGIASPRLEEHAELLKSLDTNNRNLAGGWFGSNVLPEFLDMVHLRSLDPAHLPGSGELSAGDPNRKRLIVIGDVHGCHDELQRLLQKISFDRQAGDHLIFTGDLVAKGPKSVEVVQLARKHHASCVRGNHEDRVLLRRREVVNPMGMSGDSTVPSDFIIEGVTALPDPKELALAEEINEADAEWLDSCPVILKVGDIKGMGEVVVVHAGIVPGISLERQDPSAMMTMQTIDLNTHVPSSSSEGTNWAKLFNKHQSLLASSRKAASPAENTPASNPMTVIHGHDSKRSLALNTYTKGLDTGCVKGGKLTAMIIEDGGVTSTEQVKCRDYIKGDSWLKLPFF